MEVMTPLATGGLLFIIFFILLLIGAPIMVGLGMATMACFLLLGIDLSIMVERAFASLTAFPLMALPAFVLAGALMEASGISRRLVNIAENIVGPIPGGLAISTVLSCV
ncbi:TRAP transporter large permease subunit, partial [uncultured Desulfovibrio sp.]|uniref:TRAP transporter large permease subunit n=1 Tax=uncultured Desulfovibrio sp. TaxID=167968 RepID=UPI0025CF134A